MRLTNYKYGYYDKFECSIHGKITVNRKEWQEILKYLNQKSVINSFLPSYPWVNEQLKEDINRRYQLPNGKYLVNIRVPLTKKVAERFNLSRYKKGNYMFEIQ